MSRTTNKTPTSPGCHNLFGIAISSYTRAQAIENGVLIDVTEMADDVGFQWPVALTVAAWADCVAWSDVENEHQAYDDQSGRLWDVLSMAASAVRTTSITNQQLLFDLLRIPSDGHATNSERLALKLILGPDDNGEPVITIMLPEED